MLLSFLPSFIHCISFLHSFTSVYSFHSFIVHFLSSILASSPCKYAVRFWGSDVFSSSNIVFSNGDLDPWGSAGILTADSRNPSVIPVPVIGGAHHLDLRPDHPLDPPGVKEARNKEIFAIAAWIKEFEQRHG